MTACILRSTKIRCTYLKGDPLRLVEIGGQYPFDTLFDESGSRQMKFSYALGKLTIRRATEEVYILL